jgi:hypothetical protein
MQGTSGNGLTGSANTAIGDSALLTIQTTAASNTAIGSSAGNKITTGSSNTIIGKGVASTTLATGTGNILIGTSSNVDTPASTTTNFLDIGNAIFATGVSGTLASPAGNVGIGTTAPQNKLDVTGGMALGTYAGVNSAGTGNLIASGSVGIGVTSTAGYALYVNGTAYSTSGTWSASDRRFKKDITPIPDALEKVLGLEGVNYEFKSEAFPEKHFESGKQIGLIAQDVEKVIPEAVATGKDGYKSVNYPNLVALVINSVKELYTKLTHTDQQVAAVSADISQLKAENAALKAKVENLEKISGRAPASVPSAQELEKIKSENAALKAKSDAIEAWACSQTPRPAFCH